MLFLPFPLKISLSTPKINIPELTYARKWFALFFSKTLKVLDNFAILTSCAGRGTKKTAIKPFISSF